jgi:hypothetical protein
MMKRIFTLALVLSALIANAQSIRILQNEAIVSDNDTIFVAINGHADQMDNYFGYQNLTASPIDFQIRREIIFKNEEADILYCIGDCYDANLSQPFTLAANQTVPSTDEMAFHTIYSGSTDPAMVKFTFFLCDNESDKISFYIAYGTGSDVKPLDPVKSLRAYPNPASRMVNIDYAAPSDNAFLIIKNLAGMEVYRTPISQTGKKQVDISQFTAGVYFYGVESDGKMLCTKKLLVK